MKIEQMNIKINELLNMTAKCLEKWLSIRLPRICEDWWSECVLSQLSDNQIEIVGQYNRTKLEDFDLSALLRIAKKNWYEIAKFEQMDYRGRWYIKDMIGVRNSWAHMSISGMKKEFILKDLMTLFSFFESFDENKIICKNIKELIQAVENDSDLEAIKTFSLSIEKVEEQELEIKVNNQVKIKSNNTIGFVTARKTIGETTLYTVFVDGVQKQFYEDQLEPFNHETLKKDATIEEVFCSLTACQISKPSSDNLYSLNSAKIDFVPYQYRPVLKLIKADTPRLLIADSVGVGKTIEAGLILKEMQARTPLDSVLIICPKPLVSEKKWENEMRIKFEEDFTPVTGDMLREIIRNADRDGEWPSKSKRLIIPYSLLTEDLLEGTKGRNGICGLKNLDPSPIFDMIIVDEAHHIRNRNTQAYKAVEFLCEHSTAAVFLTATPIQLSDSDLFTLLNLLCPDMVIDQHSFRAMSEPNPYINEAIKFLRQNNVYAALGSLQSVVSTSWGRNVVAYHPKYKSSIDMLKKDSLSREEKMQLIHDIEQLHSFHSMLNRTRRCDIEDFCVRTPYTIESAFTDSQQDLYDKLLEFEATALSMMHPSVPLKFMMGTILRQASSCIYGLVPAIEDILNRRLWTAIDENDDDLEEKQNKLTESEIEELNGLASEVKVLSTYLPEKDPKFNSFMSVVESKQAYDNNKIIVFSTFKHTLKYIENKLKSNSQLRIAQVNGSVRDEDRYAIRERFALPKSNPNAIDIMLFTEVGSEGLDYQFCVTMINYDLPWNPMRIEQRIGRIDRRGQKSDKVHIYNCITEGTIDADIYDRCLSRIGIFEDSIGESSEIMGDIYSEINTIVYNPKLTEEERLYKLEKLADNKVDRLREMKVMEDEERSFIGIDTASFASEIEQAENTWLSPENIKLLLTEYFNKRFADDKQYLRGNTLNLSSTDRLILKDEFKQDKTAWSRYLRGGSPSCKIVFTQEEATSNRQAIFATTVHPLVQHAAKEFLNVEERQIAVMSTDTALPKGEYPFELYAWEYTGEKPQIKIVAICNEDIAQSELPGVLQSSVKIEYDFNQVVDIFGDLETKHQLMWREEQLIHKQEVEALVKYKVESLRKSTNARINTAQKQIESANNSKITEMRTKEIEKLENDYKVRKQKLEKVAQQADIHINKIVSGVLVIKGD